MVVNTCYILEDNTASQRAKIRDSFLPDYLTAVCLANSFCGLRKSEKSEAIVRLRNQQQNGDHLSYNFSLSQELAIKENIVSGIARRY